MPVPVLRVRRVQVRVGRTRHRQWDIAVGHFYWQQKRRLVVWGGRPCDIQYGSLEDRRAQSFVNIRVVIRGMAEFNRQMEKVGRQLAASVQPVGEAFRKLAESLALSPAAGAAGVRVPGGYRTAAEQHKLMQLHEARMFLLGHGATREFLRDAEPTVLIGLAYDRGWPGPLNK